MPASYETHRRQLELILHAWGMAQPAAASTAEIMSWADLHGIDTHGISMVPVYDERRRGGKIDMKAEPVVSRETPVSALVDGQGGLGHANARRAMDLAIAKAKTSGIGVAVVRNSAHFGACGFYALMAVEAGLIGMVATSASGIQVAPTFGAQARLGTDPIAFGRRAGRASRSCSTWRPPPSPRENPQQGQRELADAARLAGHRRRQAQHRSARGEQRRLHDAARRHAGRQQSQGLWPLVDGEHPVLGAVRRHHDHRPQHTKKPGTQDIGHFMLALDPGIFRDPAEFRADVATFCDTLRATKPADPDRPVRWRAIPSGAPPPSASRPAFPSAPTCSPRSARSRWPPGARGS